MCNMDKNLLQKYIDKEIDLLEKIVLEDHLLNCPECRKNLNQLKVMDWDLNNLTMPQIPNELAFIRSSALDKYFTTLERKEAPFEGRDILNLQYRNFKNTVSFINYLPGKKIVQNAVRKAAIKGTTIKNTKDTKSKSILSRIIGL